MTFDPTFKKRPLSWSALASFAYDPDQWYSRYILNKAQPESKEMLWGKKFAESCEAGNPLAPVELYSKIEYPLKVVFNGIKMVGYCDTYEPHTKLGEFKTSKAPWTQSKVDNHGQLTMYALMLYIQHKVKPEDLNIQLQNILTKENGDFSIEFVKPIEVYTFTTKRTMSDILNFGQYIKETVGKMEEYVHNHPLQSSNR